MEMSQAKGWALRCPECGEGFLEPLMTESGRVVLFCDVAAEVWLHPADVAFGKAVISTYPSWEVVEGVHVMPGTTRWAEPEEIPVDWWVAGRSNEYWAGD